MQPNGRYQIRLKISRYYADLECMLILGVNGAVVLVVYKLEYVFTFLECV